VKPLMNAARMEATIYDVVSHAVSSAVEECVPLSPKQCRRMVPWPPPSELGCSCHYQHRSGDYAAI
jgi:hypothetical protein